MDALAALEELRRRLLSGAAASPLPTDPTYGAVPLLLGMADPEPLVLDASPVPPSMSEPLRPGPFAVEPAGVEPLAVPAFGESTTFFDVAPLGEPENFAPPEARAPSPPPVTLPVASPVSQVAPPVPETPARGPLSAPSFDALLGATGSGAAPSRTGPPAHAASTPPVPQPTVSEPPVLIPDPTPPAAEPVADPGRPEPGVLATAGEDPVPSAQSAAPTVPGWTEPDLSLLDTSIAGWRPPEITFQEAPPPTASSTLLPPPSATSPISGSMPPPPIGVALPPIPFPPPTPREPGAPPSDIARLPPPIGVQRAADVPPPVPGTSPMSMPTRRWLADPFAEEDEV